MSNKININNIKLSKEQSYEENRNLSSEDGDICTIILENKLYG